MRVESQDKAVLFDDGLGTPESRTHTHTYIYLGSEMYVESMAENISVT